MKNIKKAIAAASALAITAGLFTAVPAMAETRTVELITNGSMDNHETYGAGEWYEREVVSGWFNNFSESGITWKNDTVGDNDTAKLYCCGRWNGEACAKSSEITLKAGTEYTIKADFYWTGPQTINGYTVYSDEQRTTELRTESDVITVQKRVLLGDTELQAATNVVSGAWQQVEFKYTPAEDITGGLNIRTNSVWLAGGEYADLYNDSDNNPVDRQLYAAYYMDNVSVTYTEEYTPAKVTDVSSETFTGDSDDEYSGADTATLVRFTVVAGTDAVEAVNATIDGDTSKKVIPTVIASGTTSFAAIMTGAHTISVSAIN